MDSELLGLLFQDFDNCKIENLDTFFASPKYSGYELYYFLHACQIGNLGAAQKIYDNYKLALVFNDFPILKNLELFDFTNDQFSYDDNGKITIFKNKLPFILHLAFQLACLNNRRIIVSWMLPLIKKHQSEMYVEYCVCAKRICSILLDLGYTEIGNLISKYFSDCFDDITKTKDKLCYISELEDLIKRLVNSNIYHR